MELKVSSLRRPVSYEVGGMPSIALMSQCPYHPEITVLTAYDLKPYTTRGHVSSVTTSSCRITPWVRSRLTARWKNTYVDNYFGDPHVGAVVIFGRGIVVVGSLALLQNTPAPAWTNPTRSKMDATFVYFSQAPPGFGGGGVWATTGRPAFTSARARLPLARYPPRVGPNKRLSVTLGPCFAYPFSAHHQSFKTGYFQDSLFQSPTLLFCIARCRVLMSDMPANIIKIHIILSSAHISRHSSWPRNNRKPYAEFYPPSLRAFYSAWSSISLHTKDDAKRT